MSVSSLNLLSFTSWRTEDDHICRNQHFLYSLWPCCPRSLRQCYAPAHSCFPPGDLQVLLHLFGLHLEHPQPIHIWGILSRSLLEALSLCPPTGLTFDGSCCVVQHLSTVTNTLRWSMEKGRNIYFHTWFLRLPSRVMWPISLVLWWQSVLGLDM